jgi:predicted CoA-binding protein
MKSVAVLGASANREKFGNKAVRAYAAQGYTVFPVNPRESSVEGWPAYRSIREIPQRPDVVSVYLPPAVGLSVLPDIAARGCNELWLNPGADDPQVVEAAERLGLTVIQACSIVGLGMSPHTM